MFRKLIWTCNVACNITKLQIFRHYKLDNFPLCKGLEYQQYDDFVVWLFWGFLRVFKEFLVFTSVILWCKVILNENIYSYINASDLEFVLSEVSQALAALQVIGIKAVSVHFQSTSPSYYWNSRRRYCRKSWEVKLCTALI